MKMKSFVKGVSIGMSLAGGMAFLKGASFGSSAKRQMKKAMKNMECIADDVKYMFK